MIISPQIKIKLQNELIVYLNENGNLDIKQTVRELTAFNVQVKSTSQFSNQGWNLCYIDFNETITGASEYSLVELYFYYLHSNLPIPIECKLAKEYKVFWLKANVLSGIDLPSAVLYQRKSLEKFLSEILSYKEYMSFGKMIDEFNRRFENNTLREMFDKSIIKNYLHPSAHTFEIEFESKVTISDFVSFFELFNNLIEEINSTDSKSDFMGKYGKR